MDVQSLKLSPRVVVGKKVKQLRRQGVLPVHVYGSGIGAHTLQGDMREIRRLIPHVGANIPVSIQIEGEPGENICFVREVQRHPVTEDLLHVDFLRVDVTETISADVPIELTGEAPAVRDGGTLLQMLTDLSVEALPMDIPASIEVDLSVLDDFDKAIHVSDLRVPSNVTVLSDPEEMVARVAAPVAEEVEEVEEGAEAEATEEAAAEEESEE
jgi:large subunit ribosomal protein L25